MFSIFIHLCNDDLKAKKKKVDNRIICAIQNVSTKFFASYLIILIDIHVVSQNFLSAFVHLVSYFGFTCTLFSFIFFNLTSSV